MNPWHHQISDPCCIIWVFRFGTYTWSTTMFIELHLSCKVMISTHQWIPEIWSSKSDQKLIKNNHFYLNFSWKISTDKTAIHRIECSISWGMKWTIQNPKIQKRTSSKFIFSFCVMYNIICQKYNFFGWQKCVIRFLCFLKIVFFCFSSQKLSVKKLLFEIHMIYQIK